MLALSSAISCRSGLTHCFLTDDGAACTGGQESVPCPGWGAVCWLHQADASLHHGHSWHDQSSPLYRYTDTNAFIS